MKWLDRLTAGILIDLKDGKATLGKGGLPSRTIGEISDVVSSEPTLRGYLWKAGNGRWKFSRSIPDAVQQRIRNILASL